MKLDSCQPELVVVDDCVPRDRPYDTRARVRPARYLHLYSTALPAGGGDDDDGDRRTLFLRLGTSSRATVSQHIRPPGHASSPVGRRGRLVVVRRDRGFGTLYVKPVRLAAPRSRTCCCSSRLVSPPLTSSRRDIAAVGELFGSHAYYALRRSCALQKSVLLLII